MAQSALSRSKINTKIPQLAHKSAGKSASVRSRSRRPGRVSGLIAGELREGTRGEGRAVLELDNGVTVYPARFEGDPWRAVWYEDGRRRDRQDRTEAGLAEKLEKITVRLAVDAPGLESPGADLITYYLSSDRHPAGRAWSRKHADTQRRLCQRYLAPVVGSVACEDIKVSHMQAAVNAAPTAGEGDRVRRCISALTTAGLAGGYLVNPRLAQVHWQPGGREVPEPATAIAGETPLFVDPSAIPSYRDVARLGRALAAQGSDYELMACFAAYTGLRWGELAALTVGQIAMATRTVTVDRKVIEIGGRQYIEPPKGRKRRRTVYPSTTPAGYPLAEALAARLAEACTEEAEGSNPEGLVFLCRPKIRFWLWPGSSGSSGGLLILIGQSAQDGFSADLARAGVGCVDAGSRAGTRDALADALVGPGGVVVVLVLGQDHAQVRLVKNQGPVEELPAQGADEALADGVHPGRLHGGADDGGAGGLEDGVEGAGEVRSAVADEEPEVPEPVAEVEGQVADLLDRPVTGGVGGDAADVHAAGAVLDEHQDVQPVQGDGIDVEEVDGEDPGGLRVQELPPGRAVPARRGVDACGADDLVDRGRRDRDAELGQLAVNAPVTPQRVLLR
jgi:hypothetical protein